MENPKQFIKKSSLKLEDDNKKKHVIWNEKEIEEQEIEKHLNPKMKILEPNTPYAGNVFKMFSFNKILNHLKFNL